VDELAGFLEANQGGEEGDFSHPQRGKLEKPWNLERKYLLAQGGSG
jgi:hypothetical protein